MDEQVVPVEGLTVAMESTGRVAPAPPTRRPLSRLLVVLVVLALVAVGAAFLVSRRAGTDRRAAIAGRQRVETQLAEQRSRTEATDAQVAEDRARVETYAAATAPPLASAQQVDDLVDGQLPTLQILQDAGKAGQIATYDRAVHTSNADLEAYNLAATQLLTQTDALPPSSR